MNVRAWIDYFESNRETFLEPAWTSPCNLENGRQLDALRRSLGIFQLGETGDGTALQRYATKLAGDRTFHDYDHALQLFVDEEKVHARLLAKTVRYLGGTLIEKQWSQSAFRIARRLINLEFEIQIFVTAEIIGKAYYAILRQHVDDPVVKMVCGKLISDEVKHLNFHVEFFRQRFAGSDSLGRTLWEAQFRSIFWMTRHAVWLDHRSCLRRIGVTPDRVHASQQPRVTLGSQQPKIRPPPDSCDPNFNT